MLFISGMDLLRQFYVLPHWDRSCRSNFLPHPVTVYWHRADQSQRWPYNARRLAGLPLECQFLSHWYDLTPKKSHHKWDSNPGSSALEADALPLGQQGGIGQGHPQFLDILQHSMPTHKKFLVILLHTTTTHKNFWPFCYTVRPPTKVSGHSTMQQDCPQTFLLVLIQSKLNPTPPPPHNFWSLCCQ